MIHESDIAAWQAAQRCALAKEDDCDTEAAKRYHAPTAEESHQDLAALRALDQRAQVAGFGPLYQHDGKFFSHYGPILLRIWVEHTGMQQWKFTLCAKQERGNVIEVTEYLVAIRDNQYNVMQSHFDAAALVLP